MNDLQTDETWAEFVENAIKFKDAQLKTYESMVASFLTSIIIYDYYDWDTFLDYCNTPCLFYKVEEPDEHCNGI